MADVKISALPAASTPLTGAEVLPIVQSSVTTKVAVSNLTAGLAGTASININGTVGATTPTTGAFTSGTFSTTLGVTGTSTLTGNVAIGASTLSYSALNIGTSTLSGATDNYALYLHPTYQSSVTGAALSLLIQASTQATAFTASKVAAIQISNVTKGAGSTITTQIGLEILDQTQGGTNYAIQTNAGLVSFGGIVTASAQPAFLAQATAQANVTGDGTNYTVTFATEVFDQGSNFASPTFTAPVTGKYRFSFVLSIEDVLVGHTSWNVNMVASNRVISPVIVNPFVILDTTNGSTTLSGSTLIDMDAADTLSIVTRVSGSTKTIDISSASYLSGELVC